MTTPTPPHAAAIRAAEKLKGQFDVGRYVINDIGNEFVNASKEDIAEIITREYEPVVDALRELLKRVPSLELMRSFLADDGTPRRADIATTDAAIVKALEALQQLTKAQP